MKKFIKSIDLLGDLRKLYEFYTFLNFNFIMIYIIYKISVSLKITHATQMKF